MVCRWICAPPSTSTGAQVPHHGLHQELQGNLSSSLGFTDLGVFRAACFLFSHISVLAGGSVAIFTLSEIYSRVATSGADWPSFGHRQVHPVSGGNWFCLTLGRFLVSSNRNHSFSASTTKTLLWKPNTQIQDVVLAEGVYLVPSVKHNQSFLLFLPKFFSCLYSSKGLLKKKRYL